MKTYSNKCLCIECQYKAKYWRSIVFEECQLDIKQCKSIAWILFWQNCFIMFPFKLVGKQAAIMQNAHGTCDKLQNCRNSLDMSKTLPANDTCKEHVMINDSLWARVGIGYSVMIWHPIHLVLMSFWCDEVTYHLTAPVKKLLPQCFYEAAGRRKISQE